MNRKERRAAQKRNAAAKIAAVPPRPRDPGGLDEWGHACAAQGRIEEAAAAFEEALRLRHGPRPERMRAKSAASVPVPAAPAPSDYARLFVRLGGMANARGEPARALALVRRGLALAPDLAEAHNALGGVLLGQGRRDEAAPHLARALALAPELYETYGEVLAIFFALYPAIGDAVARAAQAWPARLSASALLGPDGLGALADNSFLRRLLHAHTACDLAFERFLASLRPLLAAALAEAAEAEAESAGPEATRDRAGATGAGGSLLALSCALARQCFLNDYVFAPTAEEAERATRLRDAIIADLAEGRPVAPLRLAALSLYSPLGDLPEADRLLARDWPPPLAEVIAQQVAEPRAERELMTRIPQLTPVSDPVSQAVRRQYEENPYPRWVDPASPPPQETMHAYLRRSFPLASAPELPAPCETLIAGCGSGRHAIEVARRFSGLRILAIDLSLASLAYALRKTRALGVEAIDYGQADIMELATLGRSFDAIDAGGVLHHLADPFAGWGILWSLLRPGGVMRVALYSALARRDIIAARRFVAEGGFAATPADIRRCREAIVATPLASVARRHDFYSVSECRDLLFHVQEHCLSLPEIGAFIAEAGARLVGFELPEATREAYRRRFPEDRTMTDLDRWNAFEQERPDAFAAMYQFWLAKKR